MLLALLALLCVAQTGQAQCLTAQDVPGVSDPNSYRELLRSKLDFSVALLKKVTSQQPSDNVFISPHSIYNALLLAYFTSGSHTEDSLRKALFLPNSQDKIGMLRSYRLQKHLASLGAYKSQVNSANRLFVSVQQTVKDCMTEIFSDEIEMVDFSPKGLGRTVQSINNWVANQTSNKIQNLVSADSISPSSQLILANAAYFKGVWKHQFDPIDTKSRKFYITKDKSVLVPMMFQQNTFNHWRSDQIRAEILELPYLGATQGKGDISLFLLLPDEIDSPRSAVDLVQRLDTNSLLSIVRESADSKNEDKVEVRLPKFSVERTLELTPILESLGVGDLFKPTSDLTGLTGGPRIQLNNAIHKAKVKVDEYGTEAAAATVFTDTRISGSSFDCDRPFLYLLYDKERSTLLFAGVYNDPTK